MGRDRYSDRSRVDGAGTLQKTSATVTVTPAAFQVTGTVTGPAGGRTPVTVHAALSQRMQEQPLHPTVAIPAAADLKIFRVIDLNQVSDPWRWFRWRRQGKSK